jgi:hypothetical protein
VGEAQVYLVWQNDGVLKIFAALDDARAHMLTVVSNLQRQHGKQHWTVTSADAIKCDDAMIFMKIEQREVF